jgi:2-oxoisovalerate dehydrogenase E1 component
MESQSLSFSFDWQRWCSAPGDTKRLDAAQGARLLFTIRLINTFENQLLRLDGDGCVWGPLHTSVGQEAVAAATIAALSRGDKIAGSHRGHHVFLAKVLDHVLDPDWNPAQDPFPGNGQEVVRRTLAEIMGLAPGYCGGRGGSMHLRHPEAGVLGTNAIVGGGIPLATGAAFAEHHRKTDNIVVCYFGDGAANQGSFHEAANLAGLWRLPIIYLVENNQYAVGTRSDEASAVPDLSLRGASYAMRARIVTGHDVVALYEGVRSEAERVRAGEGPCLIEVKCYRHYHHKGDRPGSAYGYRSREEEEQHLELDPLQTLPRDLQSAGLLTGEQVAQIVGMADQAVLQAVGDCTVGESPRQVRGELWPDPSSAGLGLRSEAGELEDLRYREIEDFDKLAPMPFSEAMAAVAGRWMERDGDVVVLGEEVANFGGGAYGATKGLPQRFPRQVVNTPISEAGFVGLACGAAMSGLRTIVEIMFPDFALVAADQLFNQIAKARHMYGNTTDMPLVARTRIATGGGFGGQHSMDPVGLFALYPGWRIVAPSNAFDYVGLFNTAMHSLDPVLFLEHHSLYGREFPVPEGNLDYCVPLNNARVVAQGADVTVLTYSSLTVRLLTLLEALGSRGVSAEIVDLRTVDLHGIDYATIGSSLEKTGVLAVVEEAAAGQGIGPRIAAEVSRRFFDQLDAPAACLASLDVPTSVSRALEAAVLISDEQILDQIEAVAKRRWA